MSPGWRGNCPALYHGSRFVVQPDLTVVCDPAELTERGMTGPPDLVLQIVSPGSGFYGTDTITAGISDAIVVDLAEVCPANRP